MADRHCGWLLAFIMLTLNITVQAQKLYWIDASCFQKNAKFLDRTKEALTMARRASERMVSSTDADFHSVFWLIFKTRINDATQYYFNERYRQYYSFVPESTNPRTAHEIVVSESIP
jgi:hypothetical protein